jgi:hypothetical protein
MQMKPINTHFADRHDNDNARCDLCEEYVGGHSFVYGCSAGCDDCDGSCGDVAVCICEHCGLAGDINGQLESRITRHLEYVEKRHRIGLEYNAWLCSLRGRLHAPTVDEWKKHAAEFKEQQLREEIEFREHQFRREIERLRHPEFYPDDAELPF